MSSITNKGGRVPDSKRIVFLGDSITENGTFIAHMDYYFTKYMSDRNIELINLGVSSETASGLSEPDHPFSRPCVHNRVNRALEISKPEWVVVSYGMNDAIYYPFSQERFNSYKEGILSLVEKINAYGAKSIVLTPPPFDVDSFKGQPQPEGIEKYSYLRPYRNYTEVLRRYSEWVLNDLKECSNIMIYCFLSRNAQ